MLHFKIYGLHGKILVRVSGMQGDARGNRHGRLAELIQLRLCSRLYSYPDHHAHLLLRTTQLADEVEQNLLARDDIEPDHDHFRHRRLRIERHLDSNSAMGSIPDQSDLLLGVHRSWMVLVRLHVRGKSSVSVCR